MSHLSVVPGKTAVEPDGAHFECSLRTPGMRASWVRATGELDLCTAPQLERTLQDARSKARLVVLDTRDVSFIDCSGLRAILDSSGRGDAEVPRLVLVPGPAVQRLLSLAGVDRQVSTCDLAPSEPLPALGLAPQPLAAEDCPMPENLNGGKRTPRRRSGQRRGHASSPGAEPA